MSEKSKVIDQNDLMSHQDDFLSSLWFGEEVSWAKEDKLDEKIEIDYDDSVVHVPKSKSKVEKSSQKFEKKVFPNPQEKKEKVIVNPKPQQPVEPVEKVKITINFPSKNSNKSSNSSQAWKTNSSNANSNWKTFSKDKKFSDRYSSNQNSWTQNSQNWFKKPFDKSKQDFWKKGNEWQNKKFKKWQTQQKPVAFQPPKEAKSSDTLVKKSNISMGESITVKEFSEKIGLPLAEVIKTLLKNKILLWANWNLDFDTASLIWAELEVVVEKQWATSSITDLLEWNINSILDQDKDSIGLETRAPIVTIMGHVDHWKTKLLDYIRSTKVVEWEAGWITQSIWAYQADYNWEKITFIDTPWHELFTSLRARGSKVADIVIIVVAADEGIKQQTIEAINHAKDANVPIIVAITKIDRQNLLPDDMLFASLSEHGLTPEAWGWETVVVKISAFSGEWIDNLLEMIILQSQLLDLKYNPARNWIWVVLEANKDVKKWNLTSIILMSWTLKVGDIVVIHNTSWKVRKLYDHLWKEIKLLKWGQPAQMMWITDLPEPGRILEVVENEKQAQKRISSLQETDEKSNSLQNILSKISQWESTTLKLILKSDSFWSLEAVKYAIEKISLPENIDIKIVHSDVWNVSDSDLPLAQASGAIMLGFNITVPHIIMKKAEQQKLTIKTFDIIYQLIEYIESIAQGLVKVEEKEVIIWNFNILWVFFKRWDEMILGWKVLDWKIKNWARFRSYHWNELLWGWRITSLKIEKENVDEVSQWHECWIRVKVDKKPDINDRLEVYIME